MTAVVVTCPNGPATGAGAVPEPGRAALRAELTRGDTLTLLCNEHEQRA
jgi:hypothetical protein